MTEPNVDLLDLNVLRLLILLVKEFHEATGRYPTPKQLQDAMLRPS